MPIFSSKLHHFNPLSVLSKLKFLYIKLLQNILCNHLEYRWFNQNLRPCWLSGVKVVCLCSGAVFCVPELGAGQWWALHSKCGSGNVLLNHSSCPALLASPSPVSRKLCGKAVHCLSFYSNNKYYLLPLLLELVSHTLFFNFAQNDTHRVQWLHSDGSPASIFAALWDKTLISLLCSPCLLEWFALEGAGRWSWPKFCFHFPVRLRVKVTWMTITIIFTMS